MLTCMLAVAVSSAVAETEIPNAVIALLTALGAVWIGLVMVKTAAVKIKAFITFLATPNRTALTQ